ncbi:MAG: hypothetical protein CSA94_02345, partial [Bacteroidetes bacterium]
QLRQWLWQILNYYEKHKFSTMKNRKIWRNALIVFISLWAILYATLHFIIEVPDTPDLFVRLTLGCFLITMVYFYIKTKDKEDY